VSDTASGLLTALLAVQGEAPTLRKDAENPHFRSKYTPLDTIVETIGPILVKHNLVWTTLPGRDEQGEPALTYRLAYAPTGEKLEGVMPLLLSKRDAQGQGSAITYARRYAMCAVLNLVGDADDDGNGASGGEPAAKTTGGTRAYGKGASREQLKLLRMLATRAKMQPHEMATFIRSLGVDVPDGTKDLRPFVDALTSRQASQIIDMLQEGPVKTGESDLPAPAADEFTHPPMGDVPQELDLGPS
jgi:hypothetical protein